MPEFVAKRPARYRGKRLKDLCGEMHAFFRDAGVSELQQAQFAAKHLPEAAMTPREASRHLVRNNVDYLPLAELDGRIATTLWVVYPPGIATIVPGERLTERARPMIDYLKMFEKSANVFPGFEAEVQGLYREVDESGRDPVPYLCGEGDACLKPPPRLGEGCKDDPAASMAPPRPRAPRGVTLGLDFA